MRKYTYHAVHGLKVKVVEVRNGGAHAPGYTRCKVTSRSHGKYGWPTGAIVDLPDRHLEER